MGTFTTLTTAVLIAQAGAPQLQWEIARADAPESLYPELTSGIAWYGPVALSLQQNGRTLWRKPLSQRMRRAFRVSADEASRVTTAPDQVWPPLPPSVITDEVVIVLDDDGVLVLRKSDGGTLLDKGVEEKDSDSTYFDRATWTLHAEGKTCSGEGHHGRLLARCGNSLAFLGSGHVVFLQLEPFRSVVVRKVEKVQHPSAAGMVVQLEERGMRLTVRGITYMQ